jgi:DNA-binding IclR family transcriptional regulator
MPTTTVDALMAPSFAGRGPGASCFGDIVSEMSDTNMPAARSALGVLRVLAARGGPLRATTLARELDVPRSSMYQLLAVLRDEGFVVHYPEDRTYGLSELVTQLGSAASASERIARLARPLLERLVASAPAPVVAHLAVLGGSEVVYAGRVQGFRAPTTVSDVGVRLPAHLTATGRAMLAALPRPQVRALYPSRDALIHRNEAGPTTLAELDALLSSARDRGWASEDGDVTAEYASVGAAALDRNGYPAAAIGVTFLRAAVDDTTRNALSAATVESAAALTSRLTGR